MASTMDRLESFRRQLHQFPVEELDGYLSMYLASQEDYLGLTSEDKLFMEAVIGELKVREIYCQMVGHTSEAEHATNLLSMVNQSQ